MTLLLSFIFMLTASVCEGHGLVKAGLCPKPTGPGICVELCSGDGDCDDNQKCCSNGCGHTCQRPTDCSTVKCSMPGCKFGVYKPEGECCPKCRPDCSVVRCALPNCTTELYTPPGECCPSCKQDCRLVKCGLPPCKHYYKPEGGCCPVCLPDCSITTCSLPGCNKLITPEGECCPVCGEKPGTCPKPVDCVFCDEYMKMNMCSIDHDCPDDQKCCSNGCGLTCQIPTDLDTCNGTCGTIAGLPCPDGTACKLDGDFPDAGGECCIENPKTIEACIQPKKPGPCKAAFPRYFYNTDTCMCEKFLWGGCQENENNFLSLAHCEKSCETQMKSNPICELPAKSGDCNGSMRRWFFNSKTCSCEAFRYSGCGANSNNFLTEDFCKASCKCWKCKTQQDVCNLPIKPDGDGHVNCKAYIPSYGYNSISRRCEKFIYSGCGGNANRFGSLEECQNRCVSCGKPADPGPCEAYIPKYFYNATTCKCERFIYGGCEGNNNNFKTIEDCLDECLDFNNCGEPEEPNCLLPKDTGETCSSPATRFYNDPLDCKCKKFKYGCGKGNSNNFLSKRLCKTSCGNTTCPVCNLPAAPGPGTDYSKRFFFNITTCSCEEFTYGGCAGNENRYETEDECEAMCGYVQCQVCNLPPAKGPCKDRFKRWYFDAAECICKSFIYGGCEGNMNRFMTKDDCEGSCGSFKCPVCTQPMQIGPCRAAVTRFYYDPSANKCKEFSWGGCQPNGNNFENKISCKKVCKNFVCPLPEKP